MRKCPNCIRPTKRTEDWACQWCGYPLVSGSYKKIPKTYRQLKEERLQEQKQKSHLGEDTAITVKDTVTSKMELSVEEIYSVCTSDKRAAATRFGNRTLVVTGIVASVVVDYDYDVYYVSLTSAQNNEECSVNCMFDKKNSSELNLLTEGQTVTIEGKYDDYESCVNTTGGECRDLYGEYDDKIGQTQIFGIIAGVAAAGTGYLWYRYFKAKGNYQRALESAPMSSGFEMEMSPSRVAFTYHF